MRNRARHIDRYATPAPAVSLASLAPEYTGLVRLSLRELMRAPEPALEQHHELWSTPGHWLYRLEIDAPAEAVLRAYAQWQRMRCDETGHAALAHHQKPYDPGRDTCLLTGATTNLRRDLTCQLDADPRQSHRPGTSPALTMGQWAGPLCEANISISFARFSLLTRHDHLRLLECSLWDRSQPLFGPRPV